MLRILRPGGRCLIYVWAKDQRRGNKPSSYLKKNVIFSNPESKQVLSGSLELPIHSNRMDFEHNDLLVPWTRKGGDQTTFLRYYHVFDEGELENLIQSAEGDCTIEKVYYDQGNWCVIVQKRPELLRKDGKWNEIKLRNGILYVIVEEFYLCGNYITRGVLSQSTYVRLCQNVSHVDRDTMVSFTQDNPPCGCKVTPLFRIRVFSRFLVVRSYFSRVERSTSRCTELLTAAQTRLLSDWKLISCVNESAE